jgi:hypothetical protein
MAAATVGVVREWVPGERRVAMVPEVVARLRSAGVEVLVEAGAGAQAWFADSAYAEAGQLWSPPPQPGSGPWTYAGELTVSACRGCAILARLRVRQPGASTARIRQKPAIPRL